MRLTDDMAEVAAAMHRENVLVYPCRFSLGEFHTKTRERLRDLGATLAEAAKDRKLFRPFVTWHWHPDIGTDRFEGRDADLVYIRDRLGHVTPILTPGLPWLWLYLAAPRRILGDDYWMTSPGTAGESRAAEYCDGQAPPVLADQATCEAVQDCMRVVRERLQARAKGEPWEVTAWKRRL